MSRNSNATWETWLDTKAMAIEVRHGRPRPRRYVARIAADILAGEQLADDGIVAGPALSSDATLYSLAGSGVDFGLIFGGSYEYRTITTARQVLLTAEANHSKAKVAFTWFSGRLVSREQAAV